MRKYKFRAWDKKKKKMLYLSPNDTILFQNGKCTVWKENQYDETEECFCCETFSDVIPMLCLGRKDKNKEELYEDDIVLYDGQKFKVIWFNNEHCLQELRYGTIFNAVFWELTERIGNIHENPELLKEGSV